MWVKSSRCRTDTPMCVEVYGLDTDYPTIRNSRDPHRVTSFDREEWSEFIDAVKRGEFDLKLAPTADAEEQLEQV